MSLCEYSRDISAGLRLLAVSADDALDDSAAYVCARIMGAQGCLGVFNSEKVKNISRFALQAYDLAENFSGSDAEREAAVKLSDYGQELYYHLSDLSAALLNGAYSLSEFGSVYFRNDLPYFENYLDFENGTEEEIFTLPVPAEVKNFEFEFLSGKEGISDRQAREKASEFIKINPALWRENSAARQGTPLYLFSHGDTLIELCKAGGVLSRIVNPMPCAVSKLSLDEAKKKAADFSADCGFENLVLLSSESADFTAHFTFAPRINNILLLTAEIKADVCLSTGEITYFDSSAYIKNYRTDVYADEEKPDFSGNLPPNLSLQKSAVCLAEIAGKQRLCLAAECLFRGEFVAVYFDYYSGKILAVE